MQASVDHQLQNVYCQKSHNVVVSFQIGPLFCSNQRLGRSLSTEGGFGFTNGWSGIAPALSKSHVHLVDVRYENEMAPRTMVIDVDTDMSSPLAALQATCDGKQTDWFVKPRLYNESTETQIRTSGSMMITLPDGQICHPKSRFGHLLVRSIRIDNEEQRIPYVDTFVSVSDRDVYQGNMTKIQGYKAWSFGIDGSIRVQRGENDILPETGVCNIVDGQRYMQSRSSAVVYAGI